MEAQDIEIMMGLLTPRMRHASERKSDAVGSPPPRVWAPEASRVISLVREAWGEFERRQAAGDAIAVAILALGKDGWSEEGIAGLQAALAPLAADSGSHDGIHGSKSDEPEPDHVAQFIHDFAVESFRAGQITHAIILFATLLHLKVEEAEGLSGLALCGVRLSRFDDALALANECLKLPVKHPRAYCIAGFCELERGNRKAAQSLLALCARIARNRPEYAEDLRAAQRVLLILHFA